MYDCQFCHTSYVWPHDLTRHIRRKYDPEQDMKSETYSSRPFIWYTTWLPFKNFNIFFALDDLAPHSRKGPNIWNPLPGMPRSVWYHYDDVIHPVTWLWRRCTSRLGMCYGEVPLFQNPGFSTISDGAACFVFHFILMLIGKNRASIIKYDLCKYLFQIRNWFVLIGMVVIYDVNLICDL